MRFILTLMDQGHTYYPKCNPNWLTLTNENQGFGWDGSPTAHTTQKIFVIGQFQTKNKSH